MSRVLYQGIEGAYQYLAAKAFFDNSNDFFGAESFAKVFIEIDKGNYDFGLVAIENSLAGSVVQNYELLGKYEVHIIGEVYLKIDHCLLSKSNNLSKLKKVFAHPMALAQCENFLKKYGHLEKVECSDNASAAKFVSQSGEPSFCAIASIECSNLYNLNVLEKQIQDQKNNWTRFIIFKNGEFSFGSTAPRSKISLTFSLDHKPGSLVNFLNILSTNDFNLTKIESRPIKGKTFEYLFWVDADFSLNSELKIDELIKLLKKNSLNLKILGIYPSFDFDKTA